MIYIKSKYLPVIAGYERIISISNEDIKRDKHNLDIALHDHNACMTCTGICGTYHGIQLHGRPAYYGLYPRGLRQYKRLHYAFFQCPSPEERKAQLEERLITDDFYECPEIRDPFKEG